MDGANCSEPTTDGSFGCVLDGTLIHVRNVYPPIQDMQPQVLVVVLIFVGCFVIGVCGKSLISAQSSTLYYSTAYKNNAILYVQFLAITDLLISLSLPPAILDSVIGFWIIGSWACKFRKGITAMSFDRFAAVCYPHILIFRQKKFVVTLITLLSFVALILLTPLLIYAQPKEVILHELKAIDSYNITRVRIFKCSDSMPGPVFYVFTITTFICGYAIPLTFICFFNFQLARRVCQHKKTATKSAVPAKRIAIYTILIAVVYWLCWTPYWFSVLYAIAMDMLEKRSEAEEVMVYAIFFVHLLPYLGSATNWVFYGLLNTQLQQKPDPMAVVTQDNPTHVRLRYESRCGVTSASSRVVVADGQFSGDDIGPNIRFIQETEQTML